jgi:hypothetical protein
MVIPQSFKSLFTDSSHVMFGLPLPLLSLAVHLITPIRIGASTCLHWICPNHLKWYCTSFSSTGATPNLSHMSSFQTWSLLLLSQIHHSMHTLATLRCWTCHFLVGQYSTLYNMDGQIAVLLNLPFSISGTLGSHKSLEAWHHFNQSTLILWLTSSSISPFF